MGSNPTSGRIFRRTSYVQTRVRYLPDAKFRLHLGEYKIGGFAVKHTILTGYVHLIILIQMSLKINLIKHSLGILGSCDGRVVKAFDSKSNRVSLRRFESCSQRRGFEP